MIKVGSRKFKLLSIFVIGTIALLTVFFAYKASSIGFNYDFEEFFPEEDKEADYFFQYRQKFSTDNDFILISIENNEGIFDSTFLRKVSQLSLELEKLSLVNFTRDITKEQEVFIYKNGKSNTRPYINMLSAVSLKKDSIRIYSRPELIGSLVSEDGKALAILVDHQKYLSKNKSDSLNNSIRACISSYEFDHLRLSGRVIGQKYYIETMSSEMKLFIGLSMILIVSFLLIAFKSIWGLIVPQLIIVLSLVWILGIMSWLNEPINILLTVLPSIMFVVGMSDVVHFLSKYIELLRLGYSKGKAILISFKEIGLATFLTSLTTSIGFFSLFLVKVKPVQKFGMATGIGVFVAFILTFSLLPILFYYTKTPKIVQQNRNKSFWALKLRRLFLFTLKNRKSIFITSSIIMLVAIIGALQLKQENFLMDDLKENSEIKQDFNYLDSTFGGVRPFELAIEAPNNNYNFFNQNSLQEIDQVHNFLDSAYGVSIKASLPLFLKIANRSMHAGNESYYKLPEKLSDTKRLKRALKIANRENGILNMVVDSTNSLTRISGTLADLGNIKVQKLNEELFEYIESEFPNSEFSYKLASTAHILDKNMSYLSISLMQGLILATIIVAIIMGLLFKDFKMVVISIIPNVIPLIIIAAIMGYFGIRLKITTAIVFTISFGIAVDDTIHFLSKFKLELNKGRSVVYALKRSFVSTGRAIIITSIILCSGFLMLMFSEFLGTFYMGLMVSVTLLIAIIADLFLLPLLLLYFYKPKSK